MFRNYAAAALRNLERNGLYAAVTITGLAIGLAAAILIGLFVRHELTYDRFIPNHDRVFLLNLKLGGDIGQAVDSDSTSSLLAADLKLAFPQIEYTARLFAGGFPPTIRRGLIDLSESGFIWADPDFFKLFDVPAIAGDPRTALENPDALVLSRLAARKYFGRDAPIGGVLLVDGHPMRVAAVIKDLPADSHLAGDVFASAESPFCPISPTGAFASGQGYLSNNVLTYVMLKPGVPASEVEAALPAFVARSVQPIIDRAAPNEHVTYALSLKPLTAIHLEPAEQGDLKPGTSVAVLAGLSLIGALIVVVAAINFVTLMTARATRRAVEVGVRKSVGASRTDLVVQFMGEALLYVAWALVLAMAMAELVLPALNAALQRRITFDYLRDPALLAAMIGVAAVTGLCAGAWPALVLSSFHPAAVLKGGPVVASGGGRLRQALVVAQFTVLIALVICALTIGRQTVFALKDATHADTSDVVMLFASPCSTSLRDAVAALPGVRGAACASPYAVGLGNNRDNVTFEGRHVTLALAPVDFGFFEVYGVEPLAGRLFQSARPSDDGAQLSDAAPPIVINKSAVRALGIASPSAAVGKIVSWHFSTPLGSPNAPARSSEVIGVVPDFNFGSARQAVQATYFYVGAKSSLLDSVTLNVKLDPRLMSTSLPAIDRVWDRVSGGQPEQRVFVDQFMLRLYVDTIIQGGFIAACAAIAVVIACLGLFALSAYTAERRTKEIGVRKAMGATAADVLGLLLWQFTWPVLAGNLIAWPIAFLAMRWWLQGFAYRVDQAPWTFVAAASAAVAIGLATVAGQSFLASRTRPAEALRYE